MRLLLLRPAPKAQTIPTPDPASATGARKMRDSGHVTKDSAQRPLADAGKTGVTMKRVPRGLYVADAPSVARASGASAGRAVARRAEGATRIRSQGLPHPVPCVLSTPEHTEADGVFCFVCFFIKTKCLYS